MSWIQAREVLARTNVVLIPIGSTEQHGPHLPLGVDTYVPIDICERVSKQTGTPICPPIWFGSCPWHMDYPGSISIRLSTVVSLATDVVLALAQHGFKHFVFVNGHTSGHDPAILVAAEDVQNQHPDLRLWDVNFVEISRERTMEICKDPIVAHGDELEASLMLIARPDLVGDRSQLKPILPTMPSRFLSIGSRMGPNNVLRRHTAAGWRDIQAASEDKIAGLGLGYVGDPQAASAEKGEAMAEGIVGNIVEFIGDLGRLDSQTETTAASQTHQPS